MTAWSITVADAAPVEEEHTEATEVEPDREVADVEDDPSAQEDQPVGEQLPSNPDSDAVDRSEEAVDEPGQVEAGGDTQGSQHGPYVVADGDFSDIHDGWNGGIYRPWVGCARHRPKPVGLGSAVRAERIGAYFGRGSRGGRRLDVLRPDERRIYRH